MELFSLKTSNNNINSNFNKIKIFNHNFNEIFNKILNNNNILPMMIKVI